MKQLLLIFCLLFSLSCKTNTFLSKVENNSIRTEKNLEEDKNITELIAPYKVKLDAKMNKVIGSAAQTLSKTRPESLLGNWTADAIHKKAQDYYGQPIDFAYTNYGGLRIPAIPKGDITVGKIFELMPFDNMLVVLEMDAAALEELFTMIAARGGDPISSHVRMSLAAPKEALINNKPLDKNKIYKMATTDYLANGGDKLFFLKKRPRTSLDKLMRDALREHVEETTKAGKMIDANLEGRMK